MKKGRKAFRSFLDVYQVTEEPISGLADRVFVPFRLKGVMVLFIIYIMSMWLA